MTEKRIADRLGEWASSVRLADVPPESVGQAKRCLIDLLGVALAGTATEVAGMARAFVGEACGDGPAALWGTCERAGVTGAAFANAVAAHALDFDDTCYAGIVHGSAVVGPAAAAAGEGVGAGGAEFLAGFIAGSEVEYALGKGLTDSLYYRGWFNTSVLGAIGAAAAAARAMGLGPAETTNAIRLAACQTAGLKVGLGTQAKPYLAGRAAEAGVHAALFARAGISAPVDAFEEERGFIRVLNDGTFEAGALDELGQVWSLETPGVAFKLYPLCSAAQAAAEAMLGLLAEHAIDPRSVDKVLCEVSRLVRISLTFERPASVSEAQFSMPFAVGCILAFGGIGVDRLSEATLADPALRAAMAKVEMREWEMSADDPEIDRTCPEGAVVTITTSDGRAFRRFNCAATGMPANPMPGAELEAKFRACAGPVLSDEQAEAWLARICAVEALPTLARLFDL